MSTDYAIATKIVEKLFGHINDCIQNDRSNVKLGMIEKGIISGMLSQKTLNGINRYIINMYPNDIKKLMNDIESEVEKRDNITDVNKKNF